MKTIRESIFDDDDIVKNADEQLVRDFLREKYYTKKNWDIKKIGNKIIVNTDGFAQLNVDDIEYLTNGMFEFGSVKGGFYCSNCESLKSLKGAPKKVGLTFNCSNCPSLESLEGAPNEVGRDFDCSNCESLKSLNGFPEYVIGNVDLSGCKKLKISQSELSKYEKRCNKIILP